METPSTPANDPFADLTVIMKEVIAKCTDHAFKEVCVDAAAGTGLPLFVGSPE